MRPRGAREGGNPHFSGKYTRSFFFFFLCHLPQSLQAGPVAGTQTSPKAVSMDV